jgi:hypothetical protein
MSKIALEPNVAGTGTFSIASPATNTNRTLTLPDETGTVLTSVSAIPAAQITGLSSGGITLLGTLVTTSGTSVTLSGLNLTGYKQLSVVCNAVSGSNGTIDYVRINSANIFIVGVNNQLNQGNGGAIIDLGSGVFWATTQYSGAANGNSYGGQSGLTTASTSITFTVSAGTFDAGSISIYGVA